MLSSLYSTRARRDTDGFTLIELLVVVIIIGLLAAIALPIFIDQTKTSVDASVKSDVRNTVTNVTNAQAQMGTATTTSAKAAVSDANTSVALVTAATTEVAVKGSETLNNVPKLGNSYAVHGWNGKGKAYLGTAANPAWVFNSDTGKFAQGTGAAPTAGATADAGGSAGSTGGSSALTGGVVAGKYTATAETDDPTNSMWYTDAGRGFTTDQAQGGTRSYYTVSGSVGSFTPSPKLVAGQQYTITGYLKTSLSDNVTVRFYPDDNTNNNLIVGNTYTTDSASWTSFSITGTVQAGTTTRPWIGFFPSRYLGTSTKQSTVYVDNLVITPTP